MEVEGTELTPFDIVNARPWGLVVAAAELDQLRAVYAAATALVPYLVSRCVDPTCMRFAIDDAPHASDCLTLALMQSVRGRGLG